jgi:hypothetical protein
MNCTLSNLDKVFKIIYEQHLDNYEHAEFDDETDLLSAVESVIRQIEEEEEK